ncbi:hypothetical protein ACHAWO_009969 [Cyclotella atomus]|uniref:Reverse transcriptase domain-containing protein n=1 Tax=Cyclotella atomus TaxID=382360 RepID=A0ABD3PVC5_9STRA
MPEELYFSQPKSKAIFIFTNKTLPSGTISLLSNGLKFCLRASKPTNNIEKSIKRFQEDVRTRYFVQEVLRDNDNDNDFNPKLYIKNPEWDPPTASEEIERSLDYFAEHVRIKQHKFSKAQVDRNTTALQIYALRSLKNHNQFVIIEADKNMGVTIWERDVYIKQVLSEHLSNAAVYENITHQIQEKIYDVNAALQRFIDNNERYLGKPVLTFFHRSQIIHKSKIAVFRATAKVHKNPVMLRPVVAKCGTAIESVSKWLDCELQKLKSEIPWCIKDSESFRSEVIKLDPPPNARLVTFDAKSMYSNIDLDHAMPVMKHWFESYSGPDLAPVDTLLQALSLVMRWNIFKFGDSYFQQLIGTAMGTSAAVFFANLYFAYHEKHRILPEYRNPAQAIDNTAPTGLTTTGDVIRIFWYARFIDDVFLIWLGECDARWNSLVSLFNNFGILKWDCEKPKKSVNFLDLNLTIEGRRVVTRTYQKPDNPYLYIPPHSAHPDGIVHGTIYGLLRTYYYQNSKYSDFIHYGKLLFSRHVNQGWDPTVLKEVFATALRKLKANLEKPPTPVTEPAIEEEERRLFFHMQYHPKDIPRREIRDIYDDLCKTTLEAELGITQFTIAYSRPTTIGSVIAKSDLYQVEGKEVSKYIAGEL